MISNRQTLTLENYKEVLDTLNHVVTVPVTLNDVKTNMEVSLKIDVKEKSFIRVNPDKIKVILDVTRFTQSSVVVPVTNPDKNIKIQTFPSKVKIFYDVALKDFDKINASDFTVVPEFNNVDFSKVEKLYLKIVKKPGVIRNVRLEPDRVEFIILK